MKFLLAGEGPGDLGSLDNQGELKKGPMVFLIDCISEKNHHKIPEYKLVTEAKLKQLKKKNKRNTDARSKVPKPYTEVFLSAQYLASNSGNLFGPDEDKAGVIFFKDSDKTNKVSGDVWRKIVRAMIGGFEASGNNKYCVPMVARPRSEAWLLGFYQKGLPKQQAYNQCKRFEDLPANDGSPNSAKELLGKALKTNGDVYDIIGKEEIYAIDWERIDMPSFNLFRKRLENVLAAMNGEPFPHSPEDEDLQAFYKQGE